MTESATSSADTASTPVDEGIERVQTMFQSVEEEFEKLQKQVEEQTEKFRQNTSKRAKRMQTELRKTPFYRQATSFSKETSKQVEKGIDQLLAALNIATRSDIKKLDRKLTQLNKKLKELSPEG